MDKETKVVNENDNKIKDDIKRNEKNKIKQEEEITEVISEDKIMKEIIDKKTGWKYYKYTGSSSGITLKHNGEDYEIILLSDCEVLLPANHDYTRKMLFNGFLKEIKKQ